MLLLAVVALVLMSGLWKPAISFDVLGTHVPLQAAVRDVLLVAVSIVSLLVTPHAARSGNEFTWEPILEVGKLFAGIFLTIIPVIAMLKAGTDGAFAVVVRSVGDANGQPVDSMYFWATGLLSSFLDNAPTYLVFFNTAGGDPATLMTRDASNWPRSRWRRVHGRQYLYRQCTEPDGEGHCRKPRTAHAQFLWLHAMVWLYPVAAVPGDDVPLFPCVMP